MTPQGNHSAFPSADIIYDGDSETPPIKTHQSKLSAHLNLNFNLKFALSNSSQQKSVSISTAAAQIPEVTREAKLDKIDLGCVLSDSKAIGMFMQHLGKEFSMECLLSLIEFIQFQDFVFKYIRHNIRHGNIDLNSDKTIDFILNSNNDNSVMAVRARRANSHQPQRSMDSMGSMSMMNGTDISVRDHVALTTVPDKIDTAIIPENDQDQEQDVESETPIGTLTPHSVKIKPVKLPDDLQGDEGIGQAQMSPQQDETITPRSPQHLLSTPKSPSSHVVARFSGDNTSGGNGSPANGSPANGAIGTNAANTIISHLHPGQQVHLQLTPIESDNASGVSVNDNNVGGDVSNNINNINDGNYSNYNMSGNDKDKQKEKDKDKERDRGSTVRSVSTLNYTSSATQRSNAFSASCDILTDSDAKVNNVLYHNESKKENEIEHKNKTVKKERDLGDNEHNNSQQKDCKNMNINVKINIQETDDVQEIEIIENSPVATVDNKSQAQHQLQEPPSSQTPKLDGSIVAKIIHKTHSLSMSLSGFNTDDELNKAGLGGFVVSSSPNTNAKNRQIVQGLKAKLISTQYRIRFPRKNFPLSTIVYFDDYKKCNIEQLKNKCFQLYKKYIAIKSEYEINVSSRVRRNYIKKLDNLQILIEDDTIKEIEIFDMFRPSMIEMIDLLNAHLRRFKNDTKFQKYLNDSNYHLSK